MSPILFMITATAYSQTLDPYFDIARDFMRGLVTSYQPSSYKFSEEDCLDSQSERYINQDIIAIGTYASLQRWDKVSDMALILVDTIYDQFLRCDLNLVVDPAYLSLTENSVARWATRLYLRNVLIRRSFNSLVSKFERANWKRRGELIGSLVRAVLPP